MVSVTRSSLPVLDLENVSIEYRQGDARLEAVRDVSLQIDPGQVVGLVGESGSGKSTLALAIMGYLGEGGVVSRGRIVLSGEDLVKLNRTQMRSFWGSKIALVPQDPLSSLNPTLRIGEQINEILQYHQELKSGEREERTLQLLRKVGLADPERIAQRYPHQISGGMQQRVMIAMAISTDPLLLMLDEPTTGLDVTTEAAILDLLRELIRGVGTSTLYVSHNLGVVSQFADRVAVLYAGELVEEASTTDLYQQPLHPYTQGLFDSVPRLGENKSEIQLRAIQGRIPSLDAVPGACVFAPRCPIVIDVCREVRPELEESKSDRRVRCHRWTEILAGEVDPRQEAMSRRPSELRIGEPVLELESVEVHYPLSRSISDRITGRPSQRVKAVDGVTLKAHSAETLGLVGESGSGKTSLARSVIGLVEERGGQIYLFGFHLPVRLRDRDAETLKKLQMVFQNPDEALNPYLSIGESLSRPFISLHGIPNLQARKEVERLLDAVGLPLDYQNRFPDQLSGGERQRIAIARAFSANPDLLICDEPVSSLDVSVQASILNLLTELQAENEFAMVFISHDLVVVGYLADRVAVLYLGQLMELADSKAVFSPPYHPYTEALLSSIPLLDPSATQESIRLEGEIPSAIEQPSGCPFHTRCHRSLGEICERETPPWRFDDETGCRILCHIPISELRSVQSQAFHIQRSVIGARDTKD